MSQLGAKFFQLLVPPPWDSMVQPRLLQTRINYAQRSLFSSVTKPLNYDYEIFCGQIISVHPRYVYCVANTNVITTTMPKHSTGRYLLSDSPCKAKQVQWLKERPASFRHLFRPAIYDTLQDWGRQWLERFNSKCEIHRVFSQANISSFGKEVIINTLVLSQGARWVGRTQGEISIQRVQGTTLELVGFSSRSYGTLRPKREGV